MNKILENFRTVCGATCRTSITVIIYLPSVFQIYQLDSSPNWFQLCNNLTTRELFPQVGFFYSLNNHTLHQLRPRTRFKYEIYPVISRTCQHCWHILPNQLLPHFIEILRIFIKRSPAAIQKKNREHFQYNHNRDCKYPVNKPAPPINKHTEHTTNIPAHLMSISHSRWSEHFN